MCRLSLSLFLTISFTGFVYLRANFVDHTQFDSIRCISTAQTKPTPAPNFILVLTLSAQKRMSPITPLK